MTEPPTSSASTRLRFDLAYDGTAFTGWAAQPGQRTVQGTLETALALILRIPAARLTVAGRTDAGVHARGQVCHLDVVQAAVDTLGGSAALQRRLSRLLPDDVVVHAVSTSPAGFDARFSALSRRYRYRICDTPNSRDPLQRHEVLAWPRSLDVARMAAAAHHLVGEHDFAAFCKRREGATTIRTLLTLSCERVEDVIELGIVADAFCHSMVRALVGSLTVVGEGRLPVTWPAEVLAARVRDSRVPVVPALGLTLMSVSYPPDAELADRAEATRSLRTLPDGAL